MGTNKERILVTGGLGFIGSHLVEKLRKLGYEPDICDLKNGSDIRDIGHLGRYDCVFHLAALRGVPASFGDPGGYFSTNVWGTYNIFEKGKGVRRIINTSSSSAKKMLSPYGMTKACGEFMSLNYDNVVTVRPYNVFGENQLTEAVIPRMAINIIKGRKPTIYGSGEQTRDFTYVKDVVDEMIWHMNHGDAGVHDMGYGKERSVNSVFKAIRGHFNSDIEAVHAPKRAGDRDRSCSPEKFHIKPAGFDKGLESTLDWFKENVGVD